MESRTFESGELVISEPSEEGPYPNVPAGTFQFYWCGQNLIDCGPAFFDSRASLEAASEEFPDPDDELEKNAFQHAYWMALVTQISDVETAINLGAMHEFDVNQGPANTYSDLVNNFRGATVGAATSTPEEARRLLVEAVELGLLSCQRGPVVEAC